jgi:glycosyltransferase involved in cell wall biosynthesis
VDTVAIVIPCLNEADNLDVLLPRVKHAISSFASERVIYVVDGGSTDGTKDVARRHGAQVLEQRGKGYGGAIRTAFEDVHAAYLITLDADLSHHPAIVRYLYGQRHEAEIVVASRYVSQGYADMPWVRKALSIVLNWTFRRALSLGVRDLSSGYRLYHRKAVSNLNLEFDTYAILQEILVKAYCEGYRVIEIPFHYLPRRHGATHARLWRFGRDYLVALGRMWRLRNSIASADYDMRAFRSRIPLQRWWQRRRYRIVLGFLGDRERVLDAGCGSSQILNGAPQIVGCDIQQRKLRFMRRQGRSLVNASTFALPFKDAAFEAVLSSQVIEHIPEDDAVFEELVRCIEPGGLLIVGTPDYGRWQWPLIERLYKIVKPNGYADEHISHYTFATLTERLTGMGLAIEDYAYILGAELVIKARKPETPTA